MTSTWEENRAANTTIDRRCIVPKCYAEIKSSIDDFEVKQDDVWVMSHPKAGTTWTQEMVWCIGNNLDFEGAKETLPKRFPFIEHMMMFSNRPVEGLPCFMKDSVRFAREMESPRFIKTHLPWQLIPRQIQDDVKQPKIIYVTRNAKDTCLSFYHHLKLLDNYPGSFDEFCKLFLEDKLYYSPFYDHVLPFWERRHQSNILFLKFEDMKKDLPSAIRKTSEFLGKTLSDEQVATLAVHLSFNKMQNNKSVNLEDAVKKANPTSSGKFIRKGEVGGWREVMSDDMRIKFDKWTVEKLRNTGLVLEE